MKNRIQSPSDKIIDIFSTAQERCIQSIIDRDNIKKAVTNYIACERYKRTVKSNRKIFDLVNYESEKYEDLERTDRR